MNVIQDGKLIKTIQVSPDSTVLKIKQSLPAYNDSMVILIFYDLRRLFKPSIPMIYRYEFKYDKIVKVISIYFHY